MLLTGNPTDIEVRRLTKLLGRKTNILEDAFSGSKEKYAIPERELQRGKGHHLRLKDFFDYFRTLLDHVGYDVRPNDGLILTSKEVRIEGETYKRAKFAYKFFKED
jgi:hypothetical protein